MSTKKELAETAMEDVDRILDAANELRQELEDVLFQIDDGETPDVIDSTALPEINGGYHDLVKNIEGLSR